jgi:hypothetical protein
VLLGFPINQNPTWLDASICTQDRGAIASAFGRIDSLGEVHFHSSEV